MDPIMSLYLIVTKHFWVYVPLVQQPQDQVMIAVGRVTPEVVRKLGVAMTSNGDVQVRLEAYQTDTMYPHYTVGPVVSNP